MFGSNSERLISEALALENRAKNRDSINLCYDFNRVKATDYESYYINASVIRIRPFLKTKFVIAQDPMENTLLDFFTMLIEWNVECICVVSLNHAFENVMIEEYKKF